MINSNIIFIWQNFDTQIYSLHHRLSLLLYSQINQFSLLLLLLLFIFGLITSLNPCLISILPILLSYMHSDTDRIRRKYSFFSGILTSFIFIVMITSLLGREYYSVISKIPILASIVTVMIGLNLLHIWSFPTLFINSALFHSIFFKKVSQDYFVGLVLGFGSVPCSTSIVVTILLWLSLSSNLILAIIYMIIYIIGYMAPILIFLNSAIKYTKAVNLLFAWDGLASISGCFILGSGIFSLLEKTFM